MKEHDLEMLLNGISVPALAHANFLGPVYDFLIDSSIFLPAVLPICKIKKNNDKILRLKLAVDQS